MLTAIDVIREYLKTHGPSTFEDLAKEVYWQVPGIETCDSARIATLRAMVSHREEFESAGFDELDNPLVSLAGDE